MIQRTENFGVRPVGSRFQVCWICPYTGPNPVGSRLIKRGTGGFANPPTTDSYEHLDEALKVMREWQAFWTAQNKLMKK